MSDKKWQLACRGIRGATTVKNNDKDEILAATRELLYIIIRANDIHPNDIASAIFTTTTDVNATFPATAARQLGWYDAALLCGHEMVIEGSLPMCIRVLIHWNTTKSPQEIHHIYLNDAIKLRPDRKDVPPIPVEEIEAAVKGFDLTRFDNDPPRQMTLQ